jgi:hypothetical protein
VAQRPARGRPYRPAAAQDLGTGPVVLLMEAAFLSVFSPLFTYLLDRLGPVGEDLRRQYFLVCLGILAVTALGMYLHRRLGKIRPMQKARSKVIPFPEHRRRRGA